jgi:hypothetical protein
MPNYPKTSTKYEDHDSSYEGEEISHSEPTRRSSRIAQNIDTITIDSSSQSDHDSESFDSAEENINDPNLFLENPPSSSSNQNSPTHSQPNPSDMSLTEEQIKQLIKLQVQSGIDAYVATNTQNAQTKIEPSPKVPNVPQLNMSNYQDWAKKMRAAMKLNHLWIEPTITPDTYSETQKATSKNAVQFIVMNLDQSNSVHVTQENENCFHTVWHALKNFHTPNTSMTLCDFYASLQNLIHRSGDCVRTHLMKLEQNFNKLAEIDEKISENHKVAIVLASIRKSPEFSHLFNSAKWVKMETLTLSNVKDTIISAQDQQKADSQNNNQVAHASSHKPQNSSFGSRRNISSRPHNRQPRDPAKGWNCTNCQMDNHSTSACRRKANSSMNHSSNKNLPRSNVALEDSREEIDIAHSGFGTFTIQNDFHNPRERSRNQLAVKSRLGSSGRTKSPYENIHPTRRSQTETRADDDIDLRLLEHDDLYLDLYNDDGLMSPSSGKILFNQSSESRIESHFQFQPQNNSLRSQHASIKLMQPELNKNFSQTITNNQNFHSFNVNLNSKTFTLNKNV